MSQFNDLVSRYLAAWNETDAEARRDLIARTWTEDAAYVDPLMSGQGHAGIDALVQGVQAQFPGFRFQQAGEADGFADRVRFRWTLGLPGQPPVAAGSDFGVIAEDGRLRSVTGFLDQVEG